MQYIIAICLRPINEKTKILIQIYLTSEAFYSLTHLSRLCPKKSLFSSRIEYSKFNTAVKEKTFGKPKAEEITSWWRKTNQRRLHGGAEIQSEGVKLEFE